MGLSQMLDHPFVWELTRRGEDFLFGLYRRRFEWLEARGLSNKELSILEIGCGIGQYASVTRGPYVGVDLNDRYVDYARKRNRSGNRVFRCADVTTLWQEKVKYDLVLMADFLHHIPDEDCVRILNSAADLARECTVIYEPVTFQPHGVGEWLVKHDRGRHIRSVEDLHGLIEKSRLSIVESSQLWLGPINTRAVLARLKP